MNKQKSPIFYFLCLFGIKLSLLSCQDPVNSPLISSKSNTPGVLSASQEISLQKFPMQMQFLLDQTGNGFVSYSSADSSEFYKMQNYRYHAPQVPFSVSGLSPALLWQGIGDGELYFSYSSGFTYIVIGDDDSNKKLRWGKVRIKDFHAVHEPVIIDYQQPGQTFVATPFVDAQGNGHLSGHLQPIHPVSQAQDNYPLAYIPFQEYQLQKNLLRLSESISSYEPPLAWFTDEEGWVLYSPSFQHWSLKNIQKQKIQEPEIPLGQSLKTPLNKVDTQGNGFIAIQTTAKEWQIHSFKNFQRQTPYSLTFDHPPEYIHRLAVFENKGVLLSYPFPLSSQGEVEVIFSYFEANKIQQTQKLRLSLSGGHHISVELHLNPQGQGLLGISTQQPKGEKPKILLYPIQNFRFVS
jgi:hypothetical protein